MLSVSEMTNSHVIAGIGRPTLELLGVVRRLPQPGGATELQQYSPQGSGAVATALVALLEWGHTCRYAGKVSDDAFGTLLRSGFDFEGFDAQGLVVAPGYLSPFSFVALAEAERMDRTVIYTPGNVPPLEPGEVDLRLLDDAGALLVDGTEPEAQIAAAREARERSIPVIYDASEPDDRQTELLDLCQVIIASERFAAEVVHQAKTADSLQALRERGPEIAIITMGIEGAMGLREGAPVTQPIFRDIPPRERGGAGYLFFAGVTHGLLQGWHLDRILRFASAAAGLSCREIGGLGGIPALDEVRETAWPNEA